MPRVWVLSILTGEHHHVEVHQVITLGLGHRVPRNTPVSIFSLQPWFRTGRQQGTDSWARLADGLAPYWPVLVLNHHQDTPKPA